MQRRRARSNNGGGTADRPRFERFAAAMARARATDAPELGLYEDRPAAFNAPAADDHQPAAYDDEPAGYGDHPAGYEDEPAAYDDQPAAYDDRQPAACDHQPAPFSSSVVRPALRPVVRRPRRARAVLRWVGIGSCVLIVCVLIAGWLAWPETARLFGRWLAVEQSDGTPRAQTVLPAPVLGPKAAASN